MQTVPTHMTPSGRGIGWLSSINSSLSPRTSYSSIMIELACPKFVRRPQQNRTGKWLGGGEGFFPNETRIRAIGKEQRKKQEIKKIKNLADVRSRVDDS